MRGKERGGSEGGGRGVCMYIYFLGAVWLGG